MRLAISDMKKIIRDIEGNQLGLGDTVRIVGVPDLSGMAPECRGESDPVFRYLAGKYKKIVGFDTTGGAETLAELEFRLKEDGEWKTHWVWIEPALLRKKRKRTKR